jgi:cytochrome c-type biogenesis protein CcmE
MEENPTVLPKKNIRWKFIIGGLCIVGAIVYLIISSTQANAQYFLTINELNQKGQSIIGKDVRISGAVIGNTIHYDSKTLELTFEIAHIPGSNSEIEAQGGLAEVLHNASTNPDAARIKVVYNGPEPDLLRDEAQAIVTGKLENDGTFRATEILLKCPTKYEEAVPSQVVK